MAITSYATLQAAVIRHAGGSSDSDFATYAVPEAITSAESEMNFGVAPPGVGMPTPALRVPEMLVRGHANIDETWETLPTDFLEMKWVATYDSDDVETPLAAATPERAGWYSQFWGPPKVYVIAGKQVRIAPKETDTDYNIRVIYYAKVPDLSASSPCTAILTAYPNLYLYGTLSNLGDWLVGDPRLERWQARFVQLIAAANHQSGRQSGSRAA